MKIDVISTSLPGNKTSKEEFNKFSGHCAGICYMADTFETLLNEDGEGSRLPLPNLIEPKDISNQIISRAVSKTFNNYISTKLNELHIKELSAEEHERLDFENFKKHK